MNRPWKPGGLVLLLLLGSLLRLISLDRSLWVDESFTLAFTGSWSQVFEYCRTHVHPPLYFLLVRGSRLLSEDITFLRAVFLPAGILSLLYIWKLARLRGDSGVALVALFLAVVSPIHIRYSGELRPYPLVLLFSAAATYAFFGLLRRENRRDRTVFILATTANLYTHYFAYLLYAAQAVLLLLSGFRKRNLRVRAAAGLLPGLLVLPWCATALAFAGRALGDGAGESGIPTPVYFVYVLMNVGRDFSGGNLISTAATLVLLLLGVHRLRNRPAGGILFDSVVLLLPFVFLTIARPSRAIAARYFLVLFPLWIVLAGAGLAAVGAFAARLLPRALRSFPGPVMAVLLPLLLFLPGERPHVWLRTDRWADIDRILASRIEEGDAVVSVPEDFTVRRVYLPYADPVVAARLGERIHVGPDYTNPLVRVDAKYKRVWVIVVGRGKRAAEIRAALAPLSVEMDHFRMVEVDASLFLITRKSAPP